jgi:hypothetical protein
LFDEVEIGFDADGYDYQLACDMLAAARNYTIDLVWFTCDRGYSFVLKHRDTVVYLLL